MFSDLFSQMHFAYIFMASVLFVCGFYSAPNIIGRKVNWMLAYPRWMGEWMEKHFSAGWGFPRVFITILVLNNVSLFTGYLSGFAVVLPLIFAFYTGFNIAVIGYERMGWEGIWQLLVNPVAWLEFPACWISYAMGMRLGWGVLFPAKDQSVSALFVSLFPLYFKYVFSLLVVAALLETALIMFIRRNDDKSD